MLESTLTLIVAALAIGSAIAMLWLRPTRTLHIVWAIFCASLAVAMVQRVTGNALGDYRYLLGLGACATCNGYWLVAHALFRRTAFTGWHFALAGTVAGLLIVLNLVRFAEARLWFDPMILAGVAGGFAEALVLFSSAVLVLTIYEGIAGWREAGSTERRMRIIFISVIASCIATTTTASGLAAGWPLLAKLQSTLEASAAVAVIVTTHLLIYWHNRIDWNQSSAEQGSGVSNSRLAFDPDDYSFADSVKRVVQRQRLYLQPELKVADVANALGVPEYRVSRAICGPLQYPNFNRFINRYRIEQACSLLLTRTEWPVLTIALESGFASIGPFNRAFKQQLGMTPTVFRSTRIAQEQGRAAVG